MTSVTAIDSNNNNNTDNHNHDSFDRSSASLASCCSSNGISKENFTGWHDPLMNNDPDCLQLELLPAHLHSSPKPQSRIRKFSSYDAENSNLNTSPLNLKEPLDLYDNIISQLVKTSPSGSSVVTDDSGYGQTNFGDTNTTNNTTTQVNNSTSGSTAASRSIHLTSQNGTYDQLDELKVDHRDEFLTVMIEDLVDWLIKMYPNLVGELNCDNFFDRLSDGVLLCHHANTLHNLLLEETDPTLLDRSRKLNGFRVGGVQALLPFSGPAYQKRGLNSNNATSSFVSRDNVSSFIRWCRQLGMPDSILFESEDLVCRKNPRNVVVCLLELARLGGRVGMEIPELVQLEVEIDEQLADEAEWDRNGRQRRGSENSDCSSSRGKHQFYDWQSSPTEDREVEGGGEGEADDEGWAENGDNQNSNATDLTKKHSYRLNRSSKLRLQERTRQGRTNSRRRSEAKPEETPNKKREIVRPKVDLRSLDEIVRDLLSQCTCKQTFPMIRIGEGRYLFGDKSTQIFVRILRSHVMVRVGGGWDTLNHFLAKYDECRKANPANCSVPSNSTVDTTDKNQLLQAVKESTPPNMSSGPFLGQGNLSVVKKAQSPCPDDQTHCCTNHNGIKENANYHHQDQDHTQQTTVTEEQQPHPPAPASQQQQQQSKATRPQSRPGTPTTLRKTFISHSQTDLRNVHKRNSTSGPSSRLNKFCTVDIPDSPSKGKISMATTAPTSPTGLTNPIIKTPSSQPIQKQINPCSVKNKPSEVSSTPKSNPQPKKSIESGDLPRRRSESSVSLRRRSNLKDIDLMKPKIKGEDGLVFVPCKAGTGPKSMNPNLSKSVGSLTNRSRVRTTATAATTTNGQQSKALNRSGQIRNQAPKSETKLNNVRNNFITPPTLKPLKTSPMSAQIRDRFARSPSYDWKTGRRMSGNNPPDPNQPTQKRMEQPLFKPTLNQLPRSEIPSTSSTSTTVSLSGSQDPLFDKTISIKSRRSSLIPLPIRSHSSSRIPLPVYVNSTISKVPEL